MNKNIFLLFPGQGAQYVGMGKVLCNEYKLANQMFEQAEDLSKLNLRKICFEGSLEDLSKTTVSQVALYTIGCAAYQFFKEIVKDCSVAGVSGLSLGEYTALVASNVIKFEDALKLVIERSRLMSQACLMNQGGMLAVMGADLSQIKLAIQDFSDCAWIANINSPQQIVVATFQNRIQDLEKSLKQHGSKRIVSLKVEGGFHSPLMDYAQVLLEPLIEQVCFQDPVINFYYSITGLLEKDANIIKGNLKKQMTQAVLWSDCLAKQSRDNPDVFIELGCGSTLSALVKRNSLNQPCFSVEKMEDFNSIISYLKN